MVVLKFQIQPYWLLRAALKNQKKSRITLRNNSNFSTNFLFPNRKLILSRQHYLIREEVFQLLHLKTFQETELKRSYDRLKIKEDDPHVDIDERLKLWQQQQPALFTSTKGLLLRQIVAGDSAGCSNGGNGKVLLNYDDYKSNIISYTESLDPRVWPLCISYLCTGLSVGIIVPCMPLLIAQLSIPPTSFGMIISIFGLSKILGNIPAAYYVDLYGRKPTMITGMLLCGLSNGAVSLVFHPSFGIPWMIFCRFIAGFGVSGFMAGGQMILSDIATPLNRTRTFAPVMAAFSAGTALGPACGGLLLSLIELPNTYLTVGGIFGVVAGMVYFTITETKHFAQRTVDTISLDKSSVIATQDNLNPFLSSFNVAFVSWRSLLQYSSIRSLVMLNSVYWFVYSGAQMTLLPLHMVHDTLQLTSGEMGMCFAYSSLISLLTANLFAIIADRYGKHKVIAMGTGFLSTSIFLLPAASSFEELLLYLTPMALGVTSLNASPMALVTELCKRYQEKPEQGLSLYRTAGDFGLLFGAVSSGVIANQFSLQTAFQVDGVIITAAMIWFAKENWKNLYRKKNV